LNKSIIQSFSYSITKASIIAQAEDRAKAVGKSFSKYIMDLIEKDLRKDEVSILSREHQASITEHIPFLYHDNSEKIELFSKIDSAPDEKLTEFAIHINQIRNHIRDRRKREFRQSDSKYLRGYPKDIG
jgi:phosphoenolpyruvate carboxylase